MKGRTSGVVGIRCLAGWVKAALWDAAWVTGWVGGWVLQLPCCMGVLSQPRQPVVHGQFAQSCFSDG